MYGFLGFYDAIYDGEDDLNETSIWELYNESCVKFS